MEIHLKKLPDYSMALSCFTETPTDEILKIANKCMYLCVAAQVHHHASLSISAPIGCHSSSPAPSPYEHLSHYKGEPAEAWQIADL